MTAQIFDSPLSSIVAIRRPFKTRPDRGHRVFLIDQEFDGTPLAIPARGSVRPLGMASGTCADMARALRRTSEG